MYGTSEASPQAVRQAVGRGCQIGWGRLLSVTNAIEAGTCRQGDVAGSRLGALERGRGGSPLEMPPWASGIVSKDSSGPQNIWPKIRTAAE